MIRTMKSFAHHEQTLDQDTASDEDRIDALQSCRDQIEQALALMVRACHGTIASGLGEELIAEIGELLHDPDCHASIEMAIECIRLGEAGLDA